jgi:hypothetical protein
VQRVENINSSRSLGPDAFPCSRTLVLANGQRMPPAALFSRPMGFARHSCTCGFVRFLRTQSIGWSVSSRRTTTTILRVFLVPSLPRRARTRINLESVLEESARASPDARIRPLSHASVDRAGGAESVGSNSFFSTLIAIRRSPNL